MRKLMSVIETTSSRNRIESKVLHLDLKVPLISRMRGIVGLWYDAIDN